MNIHKLYFYIDFLQLHKEARRDKVVERDRKMLRDEEAEDPKKGYRATINRLFRDCLATVYKEDKYSIDKTRDGSHVYLIKPRSADGKKEVRNFFKAMLLSRIDGNYRGMNINQELIGFTNLNGVELELRRNTHSIANFIKVIGEDFRGHQNALPKTYRSYTLLKRLKGITDRVNQLSAQPVNFAPKFREILLKMHRERPITVTVPTPEPVKVEPKKTYDQLVREKREQLFPSGSPGLPPQDAQLRYAETMLGREGIFRHDFISPANPVPTPEPSWTDQFVREPAAFRRVTTSPYFTVTFDDLQPGGYTISNRAAEGVIVREDPAVDWLSSLGDVEIVDEPEDGS